MTRIARRDSWSAGLAAQLQGGARTLAFAQPHPADRQLSSNRPRRYIDRDGAPLPRHHVRLPDERARLRADAGDARLARLRRGREPRRGRPDPLQHLLDPRVGRQPLHRPPRRGEAAQVARTPSAVVGVGGCWAQSVKDEVFRALPVRRRRLRARARSTGWPSSSTSDSLTAQGYFEFEDFSGHLPTQRAREFQGWLQISQGCNCVCSYCIVPSTRGPRGEPRPGRAGRRGRGAGRRRRPRGDAARPERQQLRARPAARRAGSASPSCSRGSTRSRGSSASATRARTRRTCART